MASSSVLSEGQFPGKRQRRKDPHTEDTTGAKFSGDPGESKTMRNAGSHVPKAPSVHKHHRKAGRRSHRAK